MILEEGGEEPIVEEKSEGQTLIARSGWRPMRPAELRRWEREVVVPASKSELPDVTSSERTMGDTILARARIAEVPETLPAEAGEIRPNDVRWVQVGENQVLPFRILFVYRSINGQWMVAAQYIQITSNGALWTMTSDVRRIPLARIGRLYSVPQGVRPRIDYDFLDTLITGERYLGHARPQFYGAGYSAQFYDMLYRLRESLRVPLLTSLAYVWPYLDYLINDGFRQNPELLEFAPRETWRKYLYLDRLRVQPIRGELKISSAASRWCNFCQASTRERPEYSLVVNSTPAQPAYIVCLLNRTCARQVQTLIDKVQTFLLAQSAFRLGNDPFAPRELRYVMYSPQGLCVGEWSPLSTRYPTFGHLLNVQDCARYVYEGSEPPSEEWEELEESE